MFILGLPGGNPALLGLVEGVAFLVSNSLFGWLWNSYGSAAASAYSVATTTLAIAGILLFLKKTS